MRPFSALFLLPAFVLGALLNCSTGPLCDDPGSVKNCGCRGPCELWQGCVEGICVGGNSDDNCGPEGEACALGLTCVDGTCECNFAATRNDKDACGCPPVACIDEFIDQEMCVDGTCVCNPELHIDSIQSCGCPPVQCDPGETCTESVCECNVLDNLSNALNCGCSHEACASGKVCQSGACVCAPGSLLCGDDCLPVGSHCCAPDGASCPDGSVCEAGETSSCRPQSSVPCYDDVGQFTDFCSPGTQCVTMADTTLKCVPSELQVCYDGDGHGLALCPYGYTCDVDGNCVAPGEVPCGGGPCVGTCYDAANDTEKCHPPGATPCIFDGLYAGSCPAGNTCHHAADESLACVPGGHAACYSDGEYTHSCEPGYTCLGGGQCLPPGWSTCADGSMCPVGTSCQESAADTYECHDNEKTPCFDNDTGFYAGSCPVGWACDASSPGACVQPGWTSCPDGSSCKPAENCRHTGADVYVCQPAGTNACFDNGLYTHFCQSGYTCLAKPDCLMPGEVLCPDGATCYPGSSCVPVAPGKYGCLPSGMSPCLDGQGYMKTKCQSVLWCAPETFGEKDDFICLPTTLKACYGPDNKFTGTSCPMGAKCVEGGTKCE